MCVVGVSEDGGIYHTEALSGTLVVGDTSRQLKAGVSDRVLRVVKGDHV